MPLTAGRPQSRGTELGGAPHRTGRPGSGPFPPDVQALHPQMCRDVQKAQGQGCLLKKLTALFPSTFGHKNTGGVWGKRRNVRLDGNYVQSMQQPFCKWLLLKEQK